MMRTRRAIILKSGVGFDDLEKKVNDFLRDPEREILYMSYSDNKDYTSVLIIFGRGGE